MVYPSPPPDRLTTGFSGGQRTVRTRSTLRGDTPTTLAVSWEDLLIAPFGAFTTSGLTY
jgi:hypothetical protein